MQSVYQSDQEILIIDDQLENLQVLSEILELNGYKVRKARDGKTALRTAQILAPDLILLDIRMPEMDGYEVCRQLKAHPKTQDIPIIFVSALNESLDKIKAFKAGGVDYISKPFQIDELLARVESKLTIQLQKVQLQQEIKRRQHVEDILDKSQELLKGVLNSCPVGIAFLKGVRDRRDQIGYFRCVLVNPYLAKAFGKTVEQLTNQQILRSTLESVDSTLFDQCIQLMETAEPFQQEIFYQNQWVNGWYNLNLIKHQDGFLVTILDITDRKEWEANLNRTNQNLYQLATLDGLTQVYNRRIFDLSLEQEWQRLRREQQPLSLILVDIDYFKGYNDCYGHLAGDRCLHQVAQTIKQAIKRPADLVARYGGEEFAVILPNTSLQGAEIVAWQIQEMIQSVKIPHTRSEISQWVSVSLGVSCQVPNPFETAESLILAADKALYCAKDQGRNQVVSLEIEKHSSDSKINLGELNRHNQFNDQFHIRS
ncbi:MAG: diguanylate cyclase [Microcoleaceae cyanobacterium]